jgi:hypothetical protein
MKSDLLPLLRHVILICSSVAMLSSCGPSDKIPAPSGSGNAAAPGNGAESKPVTRTEKKSPPPVVIEPKLIDLRTIALFEGAETSPQRTIANLTYKTKGDTRSVFEFYRKQFLDNGWKEAAGSSVTEASASGKFSGAGYHISVSVYPAGAPGSVDVVLHNHGNFDLSKLPVPPGAKPMYSDPITVMHVTEAPVAQTIETCKKLLADAGWEWHGSTDATFYVKQGTNRVTVMISAAPAQGGKTMINYSSELMSADLPVPPDALGVQYVDMLRRISFETTGAGEAVFAWYKPVFAKDGWKPNRDEVLHVDDKDEMIFRNGDGVIFLDVHKEYQGKRKVMLSYTTVAEIEEVGQREKAAAAKMLEASKTRETAKPKLSVAIPPGASDIKKTRNTLKFSVSNGKAKSAAEGLRKYFNEHGWKENAASLDGLAGMLSFSKDLHSVSIDYTDSGFTPAEIGVTVIGAELE